MSGFVKCFLLKERGGGREGGGREEGLGIRRANGRRSWKLQNYRFCSHSPILESSNAAGKVIPVDGRVISIVCISGQGGLERSEGGAK